MKLTKFYNNSQKNSMQGILKLNMKEKLRMKGLIKECADMSYVVSLTKEDDDGAFMIQREEN